jgi:hypothetical protein
MAVGLLRLRLGPGIRREALLLGRGRLLDPRMDSARTEELGEAAKAPE